MGTYMCSHTSEIRETFAQCIVKSLQGLLTGESSSDIEAVLSLFGHLVSQVHSNWAA